MISDTNIKDLGNDLYELNCPCAFYILFQVVEILPVGEVVGGGNEIADCMTECQSASLSVDFMCKIIEINQPFIDCLREMEGKDFEQKGFLQTDWICRVQKVNYKENLYWHFREMRLYETHPTTILANTWQNYLKPYLSELGFFNQYLPLEHYVRNFKILGENIKKTEKICSFEYCQNYTILQSDLSEKKWHFLEKNKKTAYLYAPFDIENISFNEKLLLEAQFNPQPNNWILINIKKDFILKIEKKVHYYTQSWYWFKLEGDFIRVGLNTKTEYISTHLPCYPLIFSPVGTILKDQNTEDLPLAEFDVAGSMIVCLIVLFDLEIVEINTKIWNKSQMNNPCELLEKDPFGEGWLFVVKPLNPEKTRKMFAEWYEKGYFE